MSRTNTSAPTTTFKVFTFDTGTTSLHPSTGSLTSLAVLEFDPASSSVPSHFSSYIRPNYLPAHPDVPRFPQVVTALRAFIDAVTPPSHTPLLVAHNAPFDAAFLRAELHRQGISLPTSWRFACSQSFACDVLDSPSSGLRQEDLADRFNIPVRAAHHCEDDVRVLSDIIKSLARHQAHPDEDDKDLIQDVVEKLASYANSLSGWADTYDTRSPLSAIVFFPNHGNASFHYERYCQLLREQLTAGRSVDSCCLADVNDMPHCPRCVHGRSDHDSAKNVNTSPREIRYTAHTASTPSTPQTLNHSAPNRVPNRRYIETRTGKYYHIDPECQWLRRATKLIYVTAPRSDLAACPRCPDESTQWRGHTLSTPPPYEPEAEASSRIVSGNREFIITRTGSCFHDNHNCDGLRTARRKITVTDLPSDLRPCRLCTNGEMPDTPTTNSATRSAPIRDERERTDGEAQRRNQVAEFEVPAASRTLPTEVYKTKHGNRIHVDRDCRHLRGKDVDVCDLNTEGKEPCRTCSLDLHQKLEITKWCQFCECEKQIGSLHSVVSSPGASSSVKKELGWE